MFTHPHILAEVARERQQELRAEARQYHRASLAGHAGTRTDTAARGAPGRHTAQSWAEKNTKAAGRLPVCEPSRELPAGQAR